jgi:hypothetical protein
MRVGSLWVHEDENKKKQISGEISAEAGINLAAGQKLSCKLVRNEKKQRGDRFPDYYIEAWFRKAKLRLPPEYDPGIWCWRRY